MQVVGWSLAVVVPPACLERVGECEHVDVTIRGLVGGEADEVEVAVAEDLDAVDGVDAGTHLVGVLERLTGQLDVAVDAEMRHDRPGGRHRQAGPGALQVRRGVEAAEPAVEHERLVAAEVLVPVEHHGRPLRCIAQLVDVGGDRGDARDSEVPLGHVPAEPLGERQHEAAHAGVDVEVDAGLVGHGRELADRIDHALRVLRSRTDHQDRVLVDQRGHRIDVGRPVVLHRYGVDLDAEEVGALVERRVTALGDDHLGPVDAAFVVVPLTGGQHGAQDRLGAARGHEAGGVRSVQEVRRPGDDLLLDLSEARERRGVQRVLVEIELRGLLGDLVHRGAAVVDHPEGPAVLPADVTGALADQLGDDVVDRPALLVECVRVHVVCHVTGVFAGEPGRKSPAGRPVCAVSTGRLLR